MFQQDYIMRMIEALGDFLRRLKGTVLDLDADALMDDAYKRFCGIERVLAEQMDVDTLSELLPPDRLLALSELTTYRAERFASSLHTDQLAALYHRALTLLIRVSDMEVATLFEKRALELLEYAEALLTSGDCASVISFFFLAGAFDMGEDFLFESMDYYTNTAQRQEIYEAGLAFYDKLDSLSDAALSTGEFTRCEISEGRTDLHNHFARG